jgi:hypothetical protein
MRALAGLCAAGVILGLAAESPPIAARQATHALPPSAERAYLALAPRFNAAEAMEVVSFMDQYWRLAGNPGYNASIDNIRDRLIRAGFSTSSRTSASVRVDEYANEDRGWDYRTGTVAFDEGGEAPLLSRESDGVSLAINSFSTAPGGLRAALVDVGPGTAADFDGKVIRGAIVLTDAALGGAWEEAVRKRGAAGVISTAIAAYVRAPGAPAPGELEDVLQWGTIPYDAALKSFGFKASWKAASRMRERLSRGSVMLRIDIKSAFYDGPNRTVVAEIAGRSRPQERIVMVAHVQEPGANDNGSGCGTLYALARALNDAIRSGALPPPERTLTFVWADEIRGSREWLRAHPADARNVQYMFALDMTGEDTRTTGGTFLIEKQPDPSAVWARPSDPHTEWGAGKTDPEKLRGSLLNDLHLAVCLRRARDADWVVRTNPYEGGSDHTTFGEAGVPAVLNWHFTDRYYHSNQDRPDKVSASEMQNVGIAVATSAWFLASADPRDAAAVAALLETAATERLALERTQGGRLVEQAPDRAAAQAVEDRVRTAWIKWYTEALGSVLRLPAAGAPDSLAREITAAQRRLR